MNTTTTTGADKMSITATPTSARLSHEKVTDNNHVSHYVFLCADGKYGQEVSPELHIGGQYLDGKPRGRKPLQTSSH